MFRGSTSLIIVGAEFPQRGPARRAEIAECRPGEMLELRRERAIVGGHAAVGIYSARGIQIGYAWPDSADEIAGQVAVARAIFQRPETWGAVARITLDGSAPTLPQPKAKPELRLPPQPPRDEYCDIFPTRSGKADARSGPHAIPTKRYRPQGAMGEQIKNLSEGGLKMCDKMRP